jgi:hypothetical protein
MRARRFRLALSILALAAMFIGGLAFAQSDKSAPKPVVKSDHHPATGALGPTGAVGAGGEGPAPTDHVPFPGGDQLAVITGGTLGVSVGGPDGFGEGLCPWGGAVLCIASDDPRLKGN